MKSLFLVSSAFAALAGVAGAANHEISNKALSVLYDDAAGCFTFTDRATGKAFVSRGTPDSPALKVLASGGTLTLEQQDGGRMRIELRKDEPFVFITKEVKNTTAAEADFARVSPVSFTLDLAKPAAELRTLGTGGLLAPDKNPGSYLFLTCADPATRNGVVAGFATQNHGSGVVFSSVKDGAVELKPRLDHGHLFLAPGKSAVLDTFAIGRFDDARIGLEQYASALAAAHKIQLRPKTAVYCSWYAEGPGHGGAGTEATTKELAAFIADKKLKDYGLGVIQLDDRWQDGPMMGGPATHFEQVNPKGPYPNGIAPAAKFVEDKGLTFGLWWLPFGRNHMEPVYQDKQDWFVKWPDGKPLRQKSFGGTCLDTTHPEVEKHLETLGKTIRSWGVGYYKMDGLVTGAGVDHVYINDSYKEDKFGECLPLHQKGMTNIEAMRHGLESIRKGAGKEVFFSGCCAVQNMRIYAGSIGLVDSMRVGPDFNHDGEGIRSGPLRGSRVYFLNGKVWWNDPDPTKVRTSGENCEADNSITGAVTLEQARLTSSWVSLTDQFYLISDWLPALPEERLNILKRTMLSHGASTRPVDYFDSKLPNTWLVTDRKSGARRDVLGLFNFYGEPLKVDHTLEHIGLDSDKTYHAFDFWENRLLPDVKGSYQDTIAPNSCKVIALRESVGHPVLLSTSCHVSQGMVDVTSETWADGTLSGSSKIFADDPCELRIAGTADGGHLWKAADVVLSPQDTQAGARVAFKEEPGLLRVTIQSPVNRVVKWTVRFKPQALPAPEVSGLKSEMPDAESPVTLNWLGTAPFYDISRDGTLIASGIHGSSFVDTTAPTGKLVNYQVRISGSEISTTSTLTTKALDPGPVPSLPDTSLSKLKPSDVKVGWGAQTVGKDVGGGPLVLSGKTYADGIGLHANAEAVYSKPADLKRFVAVVGLDDSQRQDPRASIRCSVMAENAAGHLTELGKTPALRSGKLEQWHFNLTLPADCVKLRLKVSDLDDGNACDHADWVNAGFCM